MHELTLICEITMERDRRAQWEMASDRSISLAITIGNSVPRTPAADM
jgi:hypothetical protein